TRSGNPLLDFRPPHKAGLPPPGSAEAAGDPAVTAAGSQLGVPVEGGGSATAGWVHAQRIFYHRDGGQFQAVASSAPAGRVQWHDGAHLLEAPTIDLTGGTLTCRGDNRYMEGGAAP
ncbi:MAG TPA: hypothetical protein VL860_13630, partial [Planctomycetota bacterium]|nr:hypothetical protein [Planctomycetota bacterium]